MHRSKTNHPVNHIARLRQQFALLGQPCKARSVAGQCVRCTWCALQMLITLGVDVVMPNDVRRHVDFKQGRPADHLVES